MATWEKNIDLTRRLKSAERAMKEGFIARAILPETIGIAIDVPEDFKVFREDVKAIQLFVSAGVGREVDVVAKPLFGDEIKILEFYLRSGDIPMSWSASFTAKTKVEAKAAAEKQSVPKYVHDALQNMIDGLPDDAEGKHIDVSSFGHQSGGQYSLSNSDATIKVNQVLDAPAEGTASV